jgi:chemotaxis protein methyltransferase CheR
VLPVAPPRPAPPPRTAAIQPDALYAGALALHARGDLARAEENLRALVSARLADGRALALLARICADQGRLATAQDWIDQAIAADELNASHHHLRATILQEQGADAAALIGFRRALYLDPQSIMTHVALGHLLVRLGKEPEARRHFAWASALDGKDTTP